MSAAVWSAIGSIGSIVTGLISSALGTSVYGLIALGVLGVGAAIGIPVFWDKIVGYFNAKTDATDQSNAGADAGNTAVDLTNQGVAVRQGLDGLQAANPPVNPAGAEKAAK